MGAVIISDRGAMTFACLMLKMRHAQQLVDAVRTEMHKLLAVAATAPADPKVAQAQEGIAGFA